MAAPAARIALVSADSVSTVGTAVSTSNADSASGTPNTTPPASRPRSPQDNVAKRIAASVEQVDNMEPMEIKNLCFVGAGFVGTFSPALICPARCDNPG
jgi:UDPglucose 6-dehydrogenase